MYLQKGSIKISVLYIPYVQINPVNASFAGDEDDAANNNIPNIPPSLQGCASPADTAGSYFYTANTPQDINSALTAMFAAALPADFISTLDADLTSMLAPLAAALPADILAQLPADLLSGL